MFLLIIITVVAGERDLSDEGGKRANESFLLRNIRHFDAPQPIMEERGIVTNAMVQNRAGIAAMLLPVGCACVACVRLDGVSYRGY